MLANCHSDHAAAGRIRGCSVSRPALAIVKHWKSNALKQPGSPDAFYGEVAGAEYASPEELIAGSIRTAQALYDGCLE